MKHRELTYYKYQLLQDFEYPFDYADVGEETDYVYIRDNTLHIKNGYAWDGASFPAINTLNFRRGSLIHDALYQLLREGELPVAKKEIVDKTFAAILKEDGMSWFRRWYVYQAVKWFGGLYLFPSNQSWITRIYYWWK